MVLLSAVEQLVPGVLSMAVMLRKPNGRACEIGLMTGTGLQVYQYDIESKYVKIHFKTRPRQFPSLNTNHPKSLSLRWPRKVHDAIDCSTVSCRRSRSLSVEPNLYVRSSEVCEAVSEKKTKSQNNTKGNKVINRVRGSNGNEKGKMDEN